ncbi:unnamed protein product, partial [Durusdinium trenchii]
MPPFWHPRGPWRVHADWPEPAEPHTAAVSMQEVSLATCAASVGWPLGSAVPCSEVLRSMARRRRWQPALALLAELRERRLKLDTVCFNIGMHACEQHWEHALQLFADLNNASLPPSVVSYGALFVSLGQGHRWAQVLQLLKPSPQLEA